LLFKIGIRVIENASIFWFFRSAVIVPKIVTVVRLLQIYTKIPKAMLFCLGKIENF
jgi:hypothetical protein